MNQKVFCTHCRRAIEGDESVYTVHGRVICEECANEETVVCDRCGERIWVDENDGNDNMILCNSCFDRYYTNCDICGELINIDDANYDDDDVRIVMNAMTSIADQFTITVTSPNLYFMARVKDFSALSLKSTKAEN